MEQEPLKSIIANVERLILDANLLIERGSAGLAMATAILAFEEAGKGQGYEFDLVKTKRTPSWHQFRQIVAAFVLSASFNQKLGIAPTAMPAGLADEIKDHWENAAKIGDGANQPIPDAIRKALRDFYLPHFEDRSDDDMMILGVEARWVKKVLIAAVTGRVEQARQRGMYVDVKDDAVTSSPATVRLEEATYWLGVAKRAHRILRFGDFQAPYGDLSAFLTSHPRPLPSLHVLLEHFREGLQGRT